MLKKYEISYRDVTINLVIIVGGIFSVIQYFVLEAENRIWLSYIDVGVLTASFMILSYWFGRNFQSTFRDYIGNNEPVEINFRYLWIVSGIAGGLNGYIASYMYFQMPGLKYKVLTTGLMLAFMFVSFIMAIMEIMGLMESKMVEEKSDEPNVEKDNSHLKLLKRSL